LRERKERERQIIAASLRMKKRLGNIEREQVREEEKRNLKVEKANRKREMHLERTRARRH
jgi:hypothetical protein